MHLRLSIGTYLFVIFKHFRVLTLSCQYPSLSFINLLYSPLFLFLNSYTMVIFFENNNKLVRTTSKF